MSRIEDVVKVACPKCNTTWFENPKGKIFFKCAYCKHKIIIKELVWACPAYKCTYRGKEGDICPRHDIRLIRYLQPKVSGVYLKRFWNLLGKTRKKKRLRYFLGPSKTDSAQATI